MPFNPPDNFLDLFINIFSFCLGNFPLFLVIFLVCLLILTIPKMLLSGIFKLAGYRSISDIQ